MVIWLIDDKKLYLYDYNNYNHEYNNYYLLINHVINDTII